MKSKLHLLIFVGIIAGVIAGLLLGKCDDSAQSIINILDLFGKTIFVGALKMIVAPLIFFSILSAITSLATTGKLWSMGWRAMLFYLVTTSIAVALGLFFVLTIKPGHCRGRDEIREHWQEQNQTAGHRYDLQKEKIQQANVIGYGELIQHIDGKISYDEAVSMIKQNSRRYAKRQMTWFRKQANLTFYESSPEQIGRASCRERV